MITQIFKPITQIVSSGNNLCNLNFNLCNPILTKSCFYFILAMSIMQAFFKPCVFLASVLPVLAVTTLTINELSFCLFLYPPHPFRSTNPISQTTLGIFAPVQAALCVCKHNGLFAMRTLCFHFITPDLNLLRTERAEDIFRLRLLKMLCARTV